MLPHAKAQLEVTPCACCDDESPQTHAQYCPSAPRHIHKSNLTMCSFDKSFPRPCRQNQNYYQSVLSLCKSALALTLGCTSMPKLSQNCTCIPSVLVYPKPLALDCFSILRAS